jgi:hypothetical protein
MVLTLPGRPDSDHKTPTAEQVAGVVAGIPTIGKACEALLKAGWRARIAGNRITVNDEVLAQFIGAGLDRAGGADPTWVIYAIAGTPPVCANPHDLISIPRVSGQLGREIFHRITFSDGQDRGLISAAFAPARNVSLPCPSAQQQSKNAHGKSHREIATRYVDFEQQRDNRDGSKGPEGRGDHAPILLHTSTDESRRSRMKSGQSR